MEKLGAILITLIFAWLIAIGLGFLSAFFIKWLWNYVAVDMFRAPVIDFWHAWALGLLTSMLFTTSVTKSSS